MEGTEEVKEGRKGGGGGEGGRGDCGTRGPESYAEEFEFILQAPDGLTINAFTVVRREPPLDTMAFSWLIFHSMVCPFPQVISYVAFSIIFLKCKLCGNTLA